MVVAVLQTLSYALSIYWWIVIFSAIFSWLYAFNVVNPHNQFVGMIGRALYQLTEPALRPIRRIVPLMGNIDISPLVLLVAIFFLQRVIWNSLIPMAVGV